MKTHIGHIQFNVKPENLPYYKDLMTFLGWQPLYDAPDMLGVSDGEGASLWFAGNVNDVIDDYDGPGLNHLGISAASQADVDALAAHLAGRGIPWLFETPRHRPEFSGSEDDTYYQVMFETPDRLLLEFVYTGPKSA